MVSNETSGRDGDDHSLVQARVLLRIFVQRFKDMHGMLQSALKHVKCPRIL